MRCLVWLSKLFLLQQLVKSIHHQMDSILMNHILKSYCAKSYFHFREICCFANCQGSKV